MFIYIHIYIYIYIYPNIYISKTYINVNVNLKHYILVQKKHIRSYCFIDRRYKDPEEEEAAA